MLGSHTTSEDSMAGTSHKLGFGRGTMIDNGDGTASYRKPASFTQAFRVRIADVTGFATGKGDKALERTLKILGNGTELASASVNHGVSEAIEAWFRARPEFRGTPQDAAKASQPGGSVADELTKLAGLRDAGVLSAAEFEEQKQRLLGH
jgi:hypothetical protein